MTIHKGFLAGTAAIAITTTSLIGTSTAPTAADTYITRADVTNTERTAKRLCEGSSGHQNYDTVKVEKKESLIAGGNDPDPDIGTLYVVHLSDNDFNDPKHCAIVIKGGRSDGKSHRVAVGIYRPSCSTAYAEADRKQRVGPVYVGGRWDRAWGILYPSNYPDDDFRWAQVDTRNASCPGVGDF